MEVISKKRKVSENIPETSAEMKKELIRLVLQTLYDSGYKYFIYRKAAELLEIESGIILESSEVKEFREGILSGRWDLVSSIVPQFKIPLGNENKLNLCIREQKYLELISEGNYYDALATLRNEVTPLHQDSKDLHQLASLLLCDSSEELKQTTEWENDRQKVLEKLQNYIPSSIMIPSSRLSVLVKQALAYQVSNCEKHCGFYATDTLLEDHTCDHFKLPAVPESVIDESNEVWDIVLSYNGEMLATVCKSLHFSVWKLKPCEKIFEVKDEVCGLCWSLDDKTMATGNSNGTVSIWCSAQGKILYSLKGHTDKVTSCTWISSTQLMTGGVDRNLILWDNILKTKTWELRVRQIEKSQDGRIIAVLNAAKNEVLILGYSPLDKIGMISEDDAITSIKINNAGTQLITAVSLSKPVRDT